MKHFTHFCSILIFISCLFSCKKSKTDTDTDTSQYIKATINGTSWTTTNVTRKQIDQYLFGFMGKGDDSELNLNIGSPLITSINFREQGNMGAVLTKFDVSRSESDLRLTWSTTQEKSSMQFIIEKGESMGYASSPYKYTIVDSVKSVGPGEHDYEYLYKTTEWYYARTHFRLKMVDSNNTFAYSNMISLTFPQGGFYKAPGQGFRRGFNGTLTVTGSEGDYMTGTFSFNVRSLTGELIKIENGEFRCRYKYEND